MKVKFVIHNLSALQARESVCIPGIRRIAKLVNFEQILNKGYWGNNGKFVFVTILHLRSKTPDNYNDLREYGD